MVTKKRQANPLYFTILGVVLLFVLLTPGEIEEKKVAVSQPKRQQPKPTLTLLQRTLMKLEQRNSQPGRECPPHFMQLSSPADVLSNWKQRARPRKVVVLSPYNCEEEMLNIKLEIGRAHV